MWALGWHIFYSTPVVCWPHMVHDRLSWGPQCRWENSTTRVSQNWKRQHSFRFVALSLQVTKSQGNEAKASVLRPRLDLSEAKTRIFCPSYSWVENSPQGSNPCTLSILSEPVCPQNCFNCKKSAVNVTTAFLGCVPTADKLNLEKNE